MASFLWGSGSASEFDELLNKITSDLLPSSTPPDLVECLHLADLIRSGSVTALAARISLLRRVSHDNPNVQILALQVLDICVKNGGTPFLNQVGGKDSSAEIERLARKDGGNRDVKERLLKSVQDWATAFMAMDGLKHTDLVRAYEKLRNEGLAFPPRDASATAAMVDSLSSPEWTDADYCTRCRTAFTMTNRKHHCRNCGQVFDQQCSSNSVPLPHYGIAESVRVCDGCLRKIKEGKGATVARSSSVNVKSSSERTNVPERSATTKGKSRREREEEDLKKAIEASLRDASGASTTSAMDNGSAPRTKDYISDYAGRSSYAPSYDAPAPAPPPPPPASKEEEEDPDLAAAIAASLRDMPPPAASAPAEYEGANGYAPQSYSAQGGYGYDGYASQPAYTPQRASYAPLPSLDLSANEASAISSFSSTLQHPPRELGNHERWLYEQAARVAPKVDRGFEDAARRRDVLVEMNEKLAEASRMYEGLLDGRVRNNNSRYSYQQPAPAQYGAQPYAPPPPQMASYYPQPQHSAPIPMASPPVSSVYPSIYPPQASPPVNVAASPPAMSQAPVSYQPPTPAAATASRAEYVVPYPPVSQYAPAAAAAYAVPQPQPAPAAEAHHPQPAPPQQHQEQPVRYYKPSEFPSVPKGPESVFLPSVPHAAPPAPLRERTPEPEVGELIEF